MPHSGARYQIIDCMKNLRWNTCCQLVVKLISKRKGIDMLIPEIHIKKILYATDLSESARYAFAYAVMLSRIHDAGITILHVIEESSGMEHRILNHISEGQWKGIKQRYEDNAQAILIGKRPEWVVIGNVLEKFCADAQNDAGMTAQFTVDEILIERGDPVEKIIETAISRRCDLMVIGSHGKNKLTQMFTGSTAQQLIKQTDKPVLVIRISEES